jgi:hypothetical protein
MGQVSRRSLLRIRARLVSATTQPAPVHRGHRKQVDGTGETHGQREQRRERFRWGWLRARGGAGRVGACRGAEGILKDLMRDAISGNQWSSMVIRAAEAQSGHTQGPDEGRNQWQSKVINGNQGGRGPIRAYSRT